MKLTKTLGVLLVGVALLAPLSRGLPAGERSGVRALQELIAAAPPGATVRVPHGVYAGPILIDKPLIVIGEGAVLDGQGQGTIVRITAPDVTLKGFVLRNSGRSLAHEDSAILVEAPRAHIEENALSDVLFGIYLKNAPESVIRHNRITGLSVPEAERGDAIRLWYSSDVTIAENQTQNARDVIVWYSRHVLLHQESLRGRTLRHPSHVRQRDTHRREYAAAELRRRLRHVQPRHYYTEESPGGSSRPQRLRYWP